jgi:AcrR family transcriptional regulator
LVQTLPQPSNRRRRKAARPGEIAAAALGCFAERGFAATRLEDVAQRAGVTKGTLYLYFPNKEELFKAVVRQAIVPNLASGEALIEETGVSASAVLGQLLTNWSKVMTTAASAIPKIVLAEAGNFPDMARFYLEEVVHRGLRLFARVLQTGIERGEFRPMDIESTTRCIVAPLILGMLWRHSFEQHEQHPLDAIALRDALLQLLSHGLAPPADAVGRHRPSSRSRKSTG